jgi:hypothetical protein
MDTLRSDVRSALRWFARQPGFFLAAVVTLALGIGATTAIFSVVSAVLLRPLPYADPDRLVRVRGSYADLADLRDAAPRLDGLAITASNLYDMGVEGRQDFFRGDVVTPDFFAVLGVQPRLGRGFTAEKDAAGERVTVISHELWQRYQGLESDVPDTLYTPLPQTPFIFSYLLVRTAGPPAAMIEPVRAAIREVAPEQSAANPKPLAAYVSESVAEPRFHTTMLGVFALVALVLASIGIYGLVAYGVAQRSRDIGIRIALGAGRGQVMRWVLGQGLGLSLAGVAVGLAGALALSRLLEKLLFGVSPTEPIIYVGVALLLLVVTALASWLPARRAARVDPMIAMRVEG